MHPHEIIGDCCEEAGPWTLRCAQEILSNTDPSQYSEEDMRVMQTEIDNAVQRLKSEYFV
jgi:hypothetical protein